MNKLKVRFMLLVVEFMIDMYEHYKIGLGLDSKKVLKYKDLHKDLVTELETE